MSIMANAANIPEFTGLFPYLLKCHYSRKAVFVLSSPCDDVILR